MEEIFIYAKYDINMSIIDIRSNVFLTDTEGYTQVDQYAPIMLLDTEYNESDRRYMYAHADNGEYIEVIHGKPMFDDLGRPNFHDSFVEWTEEEKEEKYPIEDTSEKDKQEEQLNQMMMASARVAFLNELPDDEAKDIPLCFDSWETFADGYEFIEGKRVEYKGGLWKCKKAHNKQASWYPGADPTLWEQLDKDEHAGTKEDPIPVPDSVTTSGFTYIYGKYYLENGVTYLCKRGGIPDEQAEAMYGQSETLYFAPSALVGTYFVKEA